MEKWGVTLGKTILPKNFGKKPYIPKPRVVKSCVICGTKYSPRFNNGKSKYCNNCKLTVWAERAKELQKRRAGLCVKCQLKIVGKRIACENEQGKNELWCKPCYNAALLEG